MSGSNSNEFFEMPREVALVNKACRKSNLNEGITSTQEVPSPIDSYLIQEGMGWEANFGTECANERERAHIYLPREFIQ